MSIVIFSLVGIAFWFLYDNHFNYDRVHAKNMEFLRKAFGRCPTDEVICHQYIGTSNIFWRCVLAIALLFQVLYYFEL